MAFTYDADDLSTPLAQVRFEIGDVTPATPLFSDAEILHKLADRTDQVLLTAADLCDILANRLAGQYDFKWMDQSFSRSQAAKAYAARAVSIRARAPGQGLGVVETTRIDGYSQSVPNRDTTTASKVGRQTYRDRRYW